MLESHHVIRSVRASSRESRGRCAPCARRLRARALTLSSLCSLHPDFHSRLASRTPARDKSSLDACPTRRTILRSLMAPSLPLAALTKLGTADPSQRARFQYDFIIVGLRLPIFSLREREPPGFQRRWPVGCPCSADTDRFSCRSVGRRWNRRMHARIEALDDVRQSERPATRAGAGRPQGLDLGRAAAQYSLAVGSQSVQIPSIASKQLSDLKRCPAQARPSRFGRSLRPASMDACATWSAASSSEGRGTSLTLYFSVLR